MAKSGEDVQLVIRLAFQLAFWMSF